MVDEASEIGQDQIRGGASGLYGNQFLVFSSVHHLRVESVLTVDFLKDHAAG